MMFAARRLLVAGFAVVVTAPPAWAHNDDPKILDLLPPYAGQGLRGGGYENNGGFDAVGVELLGWVALAEFGAGQQNGNDCWGYVSPSGREYAIMGTYLTTAFVEVTDPTNPQIIANHGGPDSLWRDTKVYQHYAYSVSEGGSGIQVFDMSDIDDGVVTLVNTVTTGGVTATHNVAINEDSGYLYRLGGSSNGLRIYDLSDPANPTYVSAWSDRYVHDAQIVTYTDGPYAGREIAFCCGGFNGGQTDTGIDIVDVTDKQNFINLARISYPNAGYSHQAWLTEDKQVLLLNDEFDEGPLPSTIHAIDVSDLENPVATTSFTNGSPSITHNLYVKGSLLYEANYTSGVRIFDISDPFNGVEVGYFDTRPENDNVSFNGAWSCYPYLPSGSLLVSDMERGLFVLGVDLNAVLFDFPLGLPANAQPNQPTDITVDLDSFGAPYDPNTVTLHWRVDGGSQQSAPMTPAGGDTFTGTLPGADCLSVIEFFVSAQNTEGTAYYDPSDAPNEQYAVAVYSALEIAAADNFETDTGWSVTNQELDTGAWERVVPAQGGDRGDPANDFDGSGRCYVTGNGNDEDVDGGPTILTSPAFDVSGLTDPQLRYARWFTNDDANDFLVVEISDNDGASWTPVETVGSTPGWVQQTIRVLDYTTLSADLRVRFTASDNPNDSVTEAGVDAFEIFEFGCENNAAVAVPDSLTVVRGNQIGGGLADLAESDNAYLQVASGITIQANEPPVWIEIEGVSANENPSGLSFVLETKGNTPGLAQRIRLFNFDTQQYELVSKSSIGQTDASLEVVLNGDLTRFIEDGTGRMRGEISYRAPVFTLIYPWAVSFDQAVWLISD